MDNRSFLQHSRTIESEINDLRVQLRKSPPLALTYAKASALMLKYNRLQQKYSPHAIQVPIANIASIAVGRRFIHPAGVSRLKAEYRGYLLLNYRLIRQTDIETEHFAIQLKSANNRNARHLKQRQQTVGNHRQALRRQNLRTLEQIKKLDRGCLYYTPGNYAQRDARPISQGQLSRTLILMMRYIQSNSRQIKAEHRTGIEAE